MAATTAMPVNTVNLSTDDPHPNRDVHQTFSTDVGECPHFNHCKDASAAKTANLEFNPAPTLTNRRALDDTHTTINNHLDPAMFSKKMDSGFS